MTTIKIDGVHVYKNRHGKTYCYHRATKIRIKHRVGSAEWLAEVERLNKLAPTPRRAETHPLVPTLGSLILAYRGSPEYRGLKERTRADYLKCFNYLKAIDDEPLIGFSAPEVLKIRDKAFKKRGRHFANYVVKVIRLLFSWGVPRGHLPTNPARECPMIGKPKDAPIANRRWSDEEMEVVLAEATGGVKVILGIGMFAFAREDDAVHMMRANYTGSHLNWVQRKTGEKIEGMPVTQRLHAIIEEGLAQQAVPSVYLAIGPGHGRGEARGHMMLEGQPYTTSGFRANLTRLLQRLEKAGKIGPDLTFHGLRHTAGVRLAERGVDQRVIAALLGHKTLVMAAHYSDQVEQKGRRAHGMAVLEANESAPAVEQRTSFLANAGGTRVANSVANLATPVATPGQQGGRILRVKSLK